MIGKELSALGQLVNREELMLVHVQLEKDGTVKPHDHKGQEVFFTVVKGKVEVYLDETETHVMEAGKVLHFPGEARISVKALEASEFFVYLINRRA